MFSWCNPGISSVYFHAISVENTRLYSCNTHVILCELYVFPQKNTVQYILYVKYMVFTKKTHAKHDFSWCKSEVKVGQK